MEHVEFEANETEIKDIRIFDYLAKHYEKHFVTSGIVNIEDNVSLLPVKVIDSYIGINETSQLKYAHKIEYLEISVYMHDMQNLDQTGWHNYRGYLEKFSNLKGIKIRDADSDFVLKECVFDDSDELYWINDRAQVYNYWSTRIQYIKNRGIEVLDESSFLKKSQQISKNIPWIFEV